MMSLLTGMSAKRRRISTAAFRVSATLRMTINRSTSLHSLAAPPCPRTKQYDTRRLKLTDDAVDHGRCNCVGIHNLVSVLLSKNASEGWERFSGNLATSSLDWTRLLSWRCYALRAGAVSSGKLPVVDQPLQLATETDGCWTIRFLPDDLGTSGMRKRV